MSNILVIDAGLALNLVLPGLAQARVQALVDDWQERGTSLIAPDLWLYEVTSTLTKSVHFGAVTESEGRRLLNQIHRLGVSLIPPDSAQSALAYDWTLRLGRAAAYDSFYLALAEASETELWTADRRLAAAAGLPWVRYVETAAERCPALGLAKGEAGGNARLSEVKTR